MKPITVFHQGKVIGEYDTFPGFYGTPVGSYMYSTLSPIGNPMPTGDWYLRGNRGGMMLRFAEDVPAEYRTQILLLS